MEKRIRRKIGVLAILGMLLAIALSTSVVGDHETDIWYRDDTGGYVHLDTEASGYDVGIGVVDPDSKLEIKGSTSSSSESALNVRNSADASILFVRNDGRVGISTTSPSAKLDVEILEGGGPAATIGSAMCSASQDYSVAMGSSTASGCCSTSMGFGTEASGLASTVMGMYTTASAQCTVAIGYDTTASGLCSIAMGQEIEAKGDYSIAIALSDQNGLQVTQANTMAIIGGNVGIGTVRPGALLELSKSSGDPDLRFDIGGTDKFTIGVDDSDGDKFKIGTTAIDTNTRLTIDSSGNVGIGTTSPDTTLHIGGSDAVITIAEISNTPSNPDSGTEARVYIKGDKFIIQFNDGGTVRYKYLDLTGTTTTWTHTTTPP